jgi:hypothetical protein
MLGSYVFSDVIPNMGKVTFISVKKGGSQINLELEKNLWRVAEADNYYANYILLNSLFTDVFNSQYSSLVENVDNSLFENQTVLSFFDGNKKLVEEVILGSKDDKRLYNFAKKGKDTFLITGKFVLPLDIISWIQTPAFNFQEDEIMDIYSLSEDGSAKKIKYTDTPIVFRDYMGFIYFLNAVHNDDFTVEGAGQERKFVVVSYDGLRVEFSILPKDGKYWGQVKLDTTKMPTVEVKYFVDNNSFLYEGWYFELPQDYAGIFYKYIEK